jgi:hypothetical protein
MGRQMRLAMLKSMYPQKIDFEKTASQGRPGTRMCILTYVYYRNNEGAARVLSRVGAQNSTRSQRWRPTKPRTSSKPRASAPVLSGLGNVCKRRTYALKCLYMCTGYQISRSVSWQFSSQGRKRRSARTSCWLSGTAKLQ